MTVPTNGFLLRATSIATMIVICLASGSHERTARAAPDIQSLITQAVHNTNSVKSLTHQDQNTFTTPTLTVQVTAHGIEDEIRNREQDFESVVITGHGAASIHRTVKYTVDIIFMNGLTYYRTSLAHNTWLSHKGMVFPDPYTGGWKRGRTTISYPRGTRFAVVSTSGRETHVRATVTQSGMTGSLDLWISSGSKPYVTREEQSLHAVKGQRATVHLQVAFSAFDALAVIEPPSKVGST